VQFWLSSWRFSLFDSPIFRNYFLKLQNRHGESCFIIAEIIVRVQFELTTNLNKPHIPVQLEIGQRSQSEGSTQYLIINTRIFYLPSSFYLVIMDHPFSTIYDNIIFYQVYTRGFYFISPYYWSPSILLLLIGCLGSSKALLALIDTPVNAKLWYRLMILLGMLLFLFFTKITHILI
jgi:hypothetical protein